MNGRFIFDVLKVGNLGTLKIKKDGTEVELRVFDPKPYNDHNNIHMIKGKLPFNGITMSIEYLDSPGAQQLNLWPPEEELVPQQYDQAVSIFQARAQQAVNILARYGGWQFGLIQFIGKIEFASTETRILANIP